MTLTYPSNKRPVEGIVISALCESGIKNDIDKLKQPYVPLKLIAPAGESVYYIEYKEFAIRVWTHEGTIRYDTAYRKNK